MKIDVLGIAGSLRLASHNMALLHALAENSPVGTHVTVFSNLHDVPLFNEDLEGPHPPSGVVELWRSVRAADVLLFATPEYNQSLPGVVKNAIDWLSRDPAGSPLRGKPVAVAGATVGMWGTRIAQQQLRTVLTACGSLVLPTPLLFSARAGTEMPTTEALASFMHALSTDAGRFVEKEGSRNPRD